MAMATRIAVMSRGRVLQVGTPKEIYEYPNCRFVADFIGNVNLWEGTLAVDAAARCEVKTAHGIVKVGHGVSGSQGMACAVAIRPEKITISKTRPAESANLFAGTVKEIAYFGSYNTFIVEMPGGAIVKILEANTSRYDSGDIGVYQELMRQGKLKTRLYGCSPLADYKRWANTGIHYAFGNAMLRVGCLKGFADGSLGSTTAWFFDPYLDDPKTSGLPRSPVSDGSMKQNIVEADKAGLQVYIHAIGDRANATILDFYENAAKINGPRDRRFRIEHAQHLRQQDIPRFGQLKVVASMQPLHIIDDGRWAWKRLDEKRLKGTYAFRTLLDSGAVLALGSDSPVASMDALWGIYAAVTRRTTDDKNPNGWVPEQKITVEEAVRGFTFGSAYAEFQENVKGTLEVGKLADFIVVSDDIFKIDPVMIVKAKVLTTVMDGKVVYEAR